MIPTKPGWVSVRWKDSGERWSAGEVDYKAGIAASPLMVFFRDYELQVVEEGLEFGRELDVGPEE